MASSPTKPPAETGRSGKADKADDPWLDLEMEVDVAMRAVNNAREQYRQAVDKAGGSLDDKPGPSSKAAAASADWSHVSASAAQQLDGLLSALAQQISAVEPDLEVMQQSVQAALDHPERYSVPTVELQRRQDVVQALGRRVAKAKSDVAHGMKLRERRIAAANAAAAARGGSQQQGGGGGGELRGYMQQEYDQQRELREGHDRALDRIHGGLKTAEQKAKVIGNELEDQNRALSHLDQDMAAVQMKIDNSMQRIGTLLDRTSDKGKIGIIACLMITLAVLIVFLFTGDSSNASTSSS